MKKIFTIITILTAFFTSAIAAPISWDGGGGIDNKWSTAANWNGDVAPTSADDVTIGTNVTIDFIASQTANSLTIPAGTTVILLNSSASSKNLTLAGTTSVVAGTLQLVPVGQTTTNSARIVMGTGGILSVTGAIEAGGGSATANNLTLTGGTVNVSGTMTYYNTLLATGGTLNINSGGKVVAKSGSTYTNDGTGAVNVNSGGTWEHGRNGGTIAAATFNAGSTLLITGVTTATTALTFPAAVTNYNTVTFDNPAQAANVTLSTGLTINTLNINNTGSNGNVVRLASGTTVGAVALNVGNINIAANAVFYLIYTTGTATQTPSVNVTATGNVAVAANGTLGLSDKSSLGGVLTVNGGNLTSDGNLFCSGNLSYINGSGAVTLNSNGFTKIGDPLGIVTGSTTEGNIRNAGARNFNAAHSWSFNAQGSSQVTGSGFPATCANFTSNSNVGVTLTNPLTVSNTLTITGNLSLANNGLTATTISGGSQSTHIITNGTGRLIVPNFSTTTFFPIGASAASFDPLYITPLSNSTFGARVDSVFDNPTIYPDLVVNREWDINRTSGSGAAEVSFTYNTTATTGANFNPASPVFVGHWTGSAWEEKAANLSGTTVTATGLNSFSPFIVANKVNVVPVELTQFFAEDKEKTVSLNWQTASERACRAFEIERSADGVQFQTIATVKGQGSTNQVTHYQTSDDSPLSKNYYRLRQIDDNGASHLSKTISVIHGRVKVLKLYPSVTSHFLTLDLENAASATVEIFDATGRILRQQTVNASISALDVSTLPNGYYWLRVKTKTQQAVKTFIKH